MPDPMSTMGTRCLDGFLIYGYQNFCSLPKLLEWLAQKLPYLPPKYEFMGSLAGSFGALLVPTLWYWNMAKHYFYVLAFRSHFGESIKLLGLLTLELDSQVTEIFRPNFVSVLQYLLWHFSSVGTFISFDFIFQNNWNLAWITELV